jgi:hypothetical protein
MTQSGIEPATFQVVPQTTVPPRDPFLVWHNIPVFQIKLLLWSPKNGGGFFENFVLSTKLYGVSCLRA